MSEDFVMFISVILATIILGMVLKIKDRNEQIYINCLEIFQDKDKCQAIFEKRK